MFFRYMTLNLGFQYLLKEILFFVFGSLFIFFLCQLPLLEAKTSGASILPNFENRKLAGFVFEDVKKDSEFEKAGIQSGDRLISIDNQPVKRITQVMALLKGIESDQAFSLTVERKGSTKIIKVPK